ncbi:MAG: hypothetical protein II670_00810 [Alphaproteobacteria bacterium]|nr:hypothetical protein [Alphaproteobacteria bacterium]
MTHQLQQKLFKDLSIRIPYGVMVEYRNKAYELCAISCPYGFTDYMGLITVSIKSGNETIANVPFNEVKPYLYKLYIDDKTKSSMCNDLGLPIRIRSTGDPFLGSVDNDTLFNWRKIIEWLYVRHYDVCGLIDDGIGIRVTEENNPYK